MYIYKYIKRGMCACTYTHICIYMCIHACTHTCEYAGLDWIDHGEVAYHKLHVHAYIHTYIHTYIHAHVNMQAWIG